MDASEPPAAVCRACGETFVPQRDGFDQLCDGCLLEIPHPSTVETVLLVTGGMHTSTSRVSEAAAKMRFAHYEVAVDTDGAAIELGRGAMGVTYRAFDTTLRCDVALKVVSPKLASHTHARARFLREARAAARLRHPHVAGVLFFGERAEDGQPFYAMELVEGETLQARVRRCGGLPAATVLEIAAQIAAALAAAEARGLTHRDLKPANLMLVQGESVNVKVIDFGLAKAVAAEPLDGPQLTRTQDFVGTPAFASPEQFNVWQETDARSDFYALGATLWYALTSHTPFPGRTVDEIHQRQLENVLPLDQLRTARVPPALAKLLRTLLSADPAGRPQTAAALVAALESCRREIAPAGRSSPTFRRSLALVSLAVGLLTAAMVVVRMTRVRSSRLAVAAMPVTADASAVQDKSVAVLPFENLSADKDNAFFADGVQDEVLTDLSHVADLKVISRTSVLQYKKESSRNLREIGQQLGVAYIVEGSVQRAGNKIRVTAQLIDARTDAHRWAEHYDRPVDDVFTIQSEIAQAIAGRLQAAISPQAHAAIEEAPTHDLQAYELYLKACVLWNSGLSGDPRAWLDEQVSLLTKATQRDPQFARAYAFLARAHGAAYLKLDPTPARAALARQAVEATMRLQPGSAEAHRAAGIFALLVENDSAYAHDEFVQTVRLAPNDAEGLYFLALTDRPPGLWEDSLAHFRRAAELDPENISAPFDHVETLMSLHRYSEAAAVLDRLAVAHPQDTALLVPTQIYRARIQLGWKADPPAALAALAVLPAAHGQMGRVTGLRLYFDYCARDYAAADRDLAASSLDEILGNPRAWYEGYTAYFRGDQATAEKAFLAARSLLAAKVSVTPNKTVADHLMSLAQLDAILGRKADALAEARRAAAMYPLDRDAWIGPDLAAFQAAVLALAGEREEAIRLVQTLCARPNGPSYGLLRLHPDWDSLRGDPRFEAAVASLAPKP